MTAQQTGTNVSTEQSMTPAQGGKRCRMMTANAMRMMLELAEKQAVNGQIGLDQLRRIAGQLVITETPLTPFFSRAEAGCLTTFEMAATEKKRTDHLGRLIASRLGPLLDAPKDGIERKHLPKFFSAIRMMLGDDAYQDMRDVCHDLAERHRGRDGLIIWDDYYADPAARIILEKVLVTVARTFRKFDARRDWFMILMNSSPTAVSVAPNAFVAKKPEDKAGQFGRRNMLNLFETLFAPERPEHYDDERRKGFVERWGVEPEKVFGPLFVDLAGLSAHL